MPDQERDGNAEQALWPVVDDDEPPTDEETRQLPAPTPPAENLTRVLAVPDPPPASERFTQVMALPSPPPPPAPTSPAPQTVVPPEPPNAAPVRLGPPQQPPTEPGRVEAPRRRRGRRVALILIAALILVAGVGAGAVFTVPALSNRLGITHAAPEVVIQPPPEPVRFAPALRAPGQAAAPTAAGVAAAVSGAVSPALGTFTGMVLDPVGNDVLWEQGASTPLVPASTGKLLIAAAALLSLNHTEQLSTTVVTGKDPGTVVIVGGGDPTLSSLKAGTESVYPGAAHLSDLVNQVKAAAGPVRTVLVDVSRYAGNGMEPSWDVRDVPGGYIAPMVPVMLDGGRADASKEVSARSQTPARAAAEEFARRIGAKVPADPATTAPPGAKVLGEVRSAPVVELVDTLLQHSDNVLAEAVARELARAVGEEPSFVGGSRATLKVLQDNGFDTAGLSLADASGLSGQDKVPARLLASILAVAAGPDGKDPRTAKLRPLLGGLPVAGGNGTLADRYNTPGSTPGRGWVRAKTGTLAAPPVNSLAGVVLDTDGRLLVFAFITNDTTSTTARPALDAIAAALRKCGCH